VRHDGKEKVLRTSFRPGDRLPVRDGQVVLEPPAAN
jgi:hypothetical protein